MKPKNSQGKTLTPDFLGAPVKNPMATRAWLFLALFIHIYKIFYRKKKAFIYGHTLTYTSKQSCKCKYPLAFSFSPAGVYLCGNPRKPSVHAGLPLARPPKTALKLWRISASDPKTVIFQELKNV
jgi:hypothetical protein